MRTMLQLIGGVAAAGAVAAGASAFTASGVTSDVSSPITAGGVTSVTVNEGAKLLTAKMVQDAANPDRITGVTVTAKQADGTTSLSGATLKARFTGVTTVGGSSGVSSWVLCTTTGNADEWLCDLATNHMFSVSKVEVGVLPA